MFDSKQSPERLAALVAKLESRLTDEQAEHAASKEALGVAALDAEAEVTGAEKARQNARKAVDTTFSRVAETAATLTAARQKHAAALRAEAQAQRSRQWDAFEVLIGNRETAAQALREASQTYAVCFRRWVDSNVEAIVAAPVDMPRRDVADELLRPERAVAVARLDLRRLGVAFAHPPADLIPESDFVGTASAESAVLSGMRPEGV